MTSWPLFLQVSRLRSRKPAAENFSSEPLDEVDQVRTQNVAAQQGHLQGISEVTFAEKYRGPEPIKNWGRLRWILLLQKFLKKIYSPKF